MLHWVTANLATILVCAVLLFITTLVIVHMVKDKKRGKSSCGCSCSGCVMGGTCHKKY